MEMVFTSMEAGSMTNYQSNRVKRLSVNLMVKAKVLFPIQREPFLDFIKSISP